MTAEEYIQNLQAQMQAMQTFLTVLVRKYGKENVIYAAGQAPGIELALEKEDLEAVHGAWNLSLPLNGRGQFVQRPDGTYLIAMSRGVPEERRQ